MSSNNTFLYVQEAETKIVLIQADSEINDGK